MASERTSDLVRALLARTLLAGLLVLAGTAGAADDKRAAGREREMARRLQQLQQQNGDLNAKLNDAQAKLKELGDKSEDQAKSLARAKRDIAKTAADLSAAKQESADLGAKLDAERTQKGGVQHELDDTRAALAQRDKEKRWLEDVAAAQVQTLGRQAGMIESCRAESGRLYQFGADLLQKFKDVAASRADLFTGLGKVDSFNVYQDYRDQLERLKPGAPNVTSQAQP
jgi:septal ring factor EnvC (AmiA/AmiB activator)